MGRVRKSNRKLELATGRRKRKGGITTSRSEGARGRDDRKRWPWECGFRKKTLSMTNEEPGELKSYYPSPASLEVLLLPSG